ncbi:hypothetical protein [Streptomyces laurentii]|uniref:hypothetical protein n=1 Tax=Streptomyces laurentii TaxID=39478 RepID=UPI0036AC94A6
MQVEEARYALGSAGWALGTAVVSFAAFLVIEARREHPMVPLGLFRDTTVLVAVTAPASLRLPRRRG